MIVFNPTQEMLVAAINSRNIAREAAENLIKTARQCHDAMVYLPATNHNDLPVKQGANQRMNYERNCLLSAFDALMHSAGRDYLDILRYKYKYVAMGYSARFHTDEEWAERCGHLDVELLRLEKRIKEETDATVGPSR